MELRYEFSCIDVSLCNSHVLSLIPGKYKLEAWGAQGGNYSNTQGGNGAYASGILTLLHRSKVFILVGENGFPTSSTQFTRNSYGFGGRGSHTSASGGGMTYIAHDIDSPSNAWLIAAGGGGASFHPGCKRVNEGGHGGGYIGGDGRNGTNCDSGNKDTAGGLGATQFSEGINIDKNQLNGKQFYGGNQSVSSYHGSGGGAGYYGGAAGNWYGASGGGGSSWVSDELTNIVLISGNESMPTPYLEGTPTVIGNKGHGHARITFLSNLVSCHCRYFRHSFFLEFFSIFIVQS